MQQPLVSVIIATYNGKEKRFTQTVDSILNQSYKNIELIIVNDASTNNIEEVILKYCKKYDNIIYLKNEKNCERSYSRNKGILKSKGEYIAFCDDDDIWNDKNKVKKQIEFFKKNDDYVMCGTSVIGIDEDNNEIKRIVAVNGNNSLKNVFLQSNQFAFSSVMIRKDVLLYAGLFNWRNKLGEDYELWLKIGRYGMIDNINDSFIQYRTWLGNTSTTYKSKMRKRCFRFMRANRYYYPNFLKAIVYRILIDFLLPTNFINFLVKLKHKISKY